MNIKKLLLLSAMSLFFFAITQSASAQIIQNGGFETGNFNGWTIDGHNNDPLVNSVNPHTGTFSAAAGDFLPFPDPNEPTGDSSFFQLFTVPTGGTLSFWHWDYTTDSISFDWQDAYIINSSGTILQTIFHQCNNTQSWLNTTVSLGAYVGQTVGIKFLVHQDGFGDDTGMYVDDVSVVPEPSVASLGLLGFGALAATAIVRRMRRSV
jgi:PEP-CTERM motif